jgi:hypothetical protein
MGDNVKKIAKCDPCPLGTDWLFLPGVIYLCVFDGLGLQFGKKGGVFAHICQKACRFHGMVNLQVNLVQ